PGDVWVHLEKNGPGAAHDRVVVFDPSLCREPALRIPASRSRLALDSCSATGWISSCVRLLLAGSLRRRRFGRARPIHSGIRFRLYGDWVIILRRFAGRSPTSRKSNVEIYRVSYLVAYYSDRCACVFTHRVAHRKIVAQSKSEFVTLGP